MSDTSFGGGVLGEIANPEQINLLDIYRKSAETANSIWSNRLAQSKQRAGEIYLRSLNPDGTQNQAALNQGLAAGGRGVALSALDTSQKGLTNATGDFDLQNKRLTLASNASMALLAQNPNGTSKQQIYDELDRVGPQIGLSPAQIAQAKAPFTDDGMANNRIIIRNNVSRLSALDALHATRPGVGSIANGQSTTGVQTSPEASDTPGAITPVGQPVQTGFPSREKLLEQLNQPADAETAKKLGVPVGTPLSLPLLQRLQQQGAGPDLLGPAGAPPPTVAPSARPAVGRGPQGNPDAFKGMPQWPGGNPLLGNIPGTTPATTETAAPAPAVAPQTAAPAPGGLRPVVSGVGPGVVEAANETGRQSAGAFKEISDQGVAAQSRGAVLDNMLSDTSQFTTGPGADAIARVRAVANRLGFKIDTEGLSAAESFKKLAAALNSNQGSDARLSVSEASNPHADLSPAGVDLMLRQLRGNEDYNLARAKLAASYPDRTDKIGFEAKQGSLLDPRTFQYDRMTPPQKANFFKSISDKAKFVKAHDAAASLLGGG